MDNAGVCLPSSVFPPKGRTVDAIVQIEKGLEEGHAVGEVVVSNRLRRLRAQVGGLMRGWMNGLGSIPIRRS